MTELIEKPHAGGFILSEANGHLSRENITIASGQSLNAGAVLGKISASGKYAEHDPAASDGTEVAAGVLYAAVDASDADAKGVALVRLAEVNANELVWPDGISGGDKTDALAALAQTFVVAR